MVHYALIKVNREQQQTYLYGSNKDDFIYNGQKCHVVTQGQLLGISFGL